MQSLGRGGVFSVKRPVTSTAVLAKSIDGPFTRVLAANTLTVTADPVLNNPPNLPPFIGGHYTIIGETVTFSGTVSILYLPTAPPGPVDVKIEVELPVPTFVKPFTSGSSNGRGFISQLTLTTYVQGITNNKLKLSVAYPNVVGIPEEILVSFIVQYQI